MQIFLFQKIKFINWEISIFQKLLKMELQYQKLERLYIQVQKFGIIYLIVVVVIFGV